MLKLYTNVITGKTYDENGDLFEDGMPQAFYKSTMRVAWQLCSETPDIAEGSDDTPETAWTKCTDYSQYAAVGAFLTADSDYIKRRQGTLSAAVSAGSVSTIEATVNDADFDTIPSTGVIELFDSEGESEVVKYNARSIEDGVVTFTLVDGSTVERSYESGSPMDCSDEPLMQASLDTLNSDVANGLFCFKIRAFSRKLHDLVAYSNTKTIDVMGLELAIFRIDSDTNAVVDLERFEVDTFQIRTGMAETSANPPVTDPEANEIVTLCNTLLAAGFSLQFSADGSSWHDTQVTTGETIDVFFRFRSAGSGGTWSNGIRLVKGDKGEKGDKGDTGDQGDSAFLYIRYASDTQGTGFSATPSDSLPYIGVLATTEAIETPSASDFTGLWVSFKGPKGDKGDKGDPGTNGTNGTNGTDGANAYFYVRYASDDQGTDFSATPSSSRKYIAAKTTTTAIANPSASDFSGLWVRYIGNDGTNGTNGTNGTSSYTYVGYAEDSNGTGFSMTPSASRKYVAFKVSATEISNPTASTFSGLWVKFIGDNGSPAEAALEGVKLNGELLTPTDKVVDVNALPIVTTLPAVADTTQDVVLYKGENDATANPPLIKGHTYSREGSWSDSTITVIVGNSTYTLSKVGSENKWTDNGQLSWEDYALVWGGTSSGSWEFVNGGSPSLYSPSCEYTTMPWDPAISGTQWDDHDGWTPIVVVKRAFNGSWVDLSPQDYLPVVKTMPTASATSEDIVFYGGEDVTGAEKGHTYEKHVDYDDSTLGINWSGWTETLTKNQSGGWSNSLNTLSYNSTNGWWSFSNDYDNGQHSSQCANTVMPWDSSLTWYNNGGSTPITVTFTLAVPPTYSWNDITPSRNTKLNGKTIEPSADKSVNIMALPIAIDSMPTADADAQPFILYLGTTGGGYSKGHLYEKTATVDDSSITVEINGLAVFMTGGGGSWTNQEVSPTMNLYYSSSVGAWVLERGFNYTSPQCPSTTMPWDPAVSGKTWNYLEYGSITPIISDPTVYDWNDLGSILGA